MNEDRPSGTDSLGERAARARETIRNHRPTDAWRCAFCLADLDMDVAWPCPDHRTAARFLSAHTYTHTDDPRTD